MPKKLYTVTIRFEDWTYAVEQVTSQTAEEALEKALCESEALRERDEEAVRDFATKQVNVFQQAKVRGVWHWYPVPNDCQATSGIYGGVIVQTDSGAPERTAG